MNNVAVLIVMTIQWRTNFFKLPSHINSTMIPIYLFCDIRIVSVKIISQGGHDFEVAVMISRIYVNTECGSYSFLRINDVCNFWDK